MNKTALFGGSFNPPHLGHTAFVEALVEDSQFSHVWVLPCANHAFGKALADFDHRSRMCRLAFAHLSPKVEIRSDELDVNGNGYTIELIEYLLEQHPQAEFSLVLGADNYAVRHKWKDFDRIESLVHVQFYGRKGWQEANHELAAETPFPKVSSTEIRDRAHRGESLQGLVPEQVAQYIEENRLY